MKYILFLAAVAFLFVSCSSGNIGKATKPQTDSDLPFTTHDSLSDDDTTPLTDIDTVEPDTDKLEPDAVVTETDAFIAEADTVISETDAVITEADTVISEIDTINDSDIDSAITNTVATPKFSISGGTYNIAQSVGITVQTPGASVYYTTDGSDPTDSSLLYSSPLTISTNTTLKAIAYKTGLTNSAIKSATYTLKPATPSFLPSGGVYSTDQSITIDTSINDGTIIYTLDGSDPSDINGETYTTPISLPANGADDTYPVIRAIVIKAGWTDSEIGTANYHLTGTVATPEISPEGGTFTTPKSITMTCATNGATIRYTKDGSEVTNVSSAYSGLIQLDNAAISNVKAKAFKQNWVTSGIASKSYTIDNIPAPVITPDSGIYDAPPQVSITTIAPSATIRYTLDGTEPTEASTAYTGTTTLSVTAILTAKVFKAGFTTSPKTEKSYIIGGAGFCTLAATPSHGTYNTSQAVALSCSTAGSVIRYEINTPEPDMQSNLYIGPLGIAETATLKAIAYKLGTAGYSKISPTYTIIPGADKAATPQFTPPAGTYSGANKDITITTATSGATIRYTTDGKEPSELNGSAYSTPITISVGSTTIKAKAFKSGMADSDTATADYIIPPSWKKIAAGGYHTCGIKESDSKLYCWGWNADGQIGDGTAVEKHTPTKIGNATWSEISTGEHHTCGITKADSKLFCWGNNHSGQLGDGTSLTASSTPKKIGDAAWIKVSAGYAHTCGILETDHKLYCWGFNENGEIGDGTTVDKLVPTKIGDDTWSAITTNGSNGAGHTCGIKELDKKLYCWGNNGNGQLGDGTTDSKNTPTKIGNDNWIEIINGQQYTCGIKESENKLYCWGFNGYGQLGDGTTAEKSFPTKIGNDTWSQITVGYYHTCGIKADNKLYCWGYNEFGQLGEGTNTDKNTPAKIENDSWIGIQAGGNHTCGIKITDNKLYCWGGNGYGVLGNGTTVDKSAPTLVVEP